MRHLSCQYRGAVCDCLFPAAAVQRISRIKYVSSWSCYPLPEHTDLYAFVL